LTKHFIFNTLFSDKLPTYSRACLSPRNTFTTH